jgi:5-formaminoimidazole-4-carboxamide-1-beta-D-ribofuranosyl 5'-monophosphate synthetase
MVKALTERTKIFTTGMLTGLTSADNETLLIDISGRCCAEVNVLFCGEPMRKLAYQHSKQAPLIPISCVGGY